MIVNDSYSLFFRFIEKFLPSGFRDIDPHDPLVKEIDKLTMTNNQFFFIGDLLQMKIFFTSRRSMDMLGVPPEKIDPSVFFITTHPDDLKRHNLARTKLFNVGQDLYINKSGPSFLSINFRMKNALGTYTNILNQGVFIYTLIPYETVFYMQVFTDISWFKKIRHGFHYYIGNNPEYFRFPDDKLLMTGNIFSDREFGIIEMIAQGLTSEQIAEKLFLSIHTINTHRRNILKKTGKTTTTELVFDLKNKGIL